MRSRLGGLGLLVLAVAVGACSSASSTPRAATKRTTTTAAAAATTSSRPPTSTSTSVATSTSTATATPTSVRPATPPQQVATAFFAAWVAGNTATMRADGSSRAVSDAQSARTGGTSGFAFSNCGGAAGSIYCTWVRVAEAVQLQVDDVDAPHRVVGFTRTQLDTRAVADEFEAAWAAGSNAALRALGTPEAVTTALALAPHARDGWSYTRSDGTAGSLYYIWQHGSATFTLRVDDVAPVPVVSQVLYQP